MICTNKSVIFLWTGADDESMGTASSFVLFSFSFGLNRRLALCLAVHLLSQVWLKWDSHTWEFICNPSQSSHHVCPSEFPGPGLHLSDKSSLTSPLNITAARKYSSNNNSSIRHDFPISPNSSLVLLLTGSSLILQIPISYPIEWIYVAQRPVISCVGCPTV